MKVGTKSILFGAHQFVLHPFILALAWWRLFGFPADPRLWVVFVVHDLGYWGKPNMDGDEGERHVEFGARLVRRWFGDKWGDLCLFHSRFYAKRAGKHFSKLCVADKLAIILEPWWVYLPRVIWSGEIEEYMKIAQGRAGAKYGNEMRDVSSKRAWHRSMVAYVTAWVEEHKDMREDVWTLGAAK